MHPNVVIRSNITILVVEDSLTQAAAIQFLLEDDGYNIVLAHDGQEALEWLQNNEKKPDIIITDIEIPRLDGYELCKAVRADERLRDISVILLTSLSEPVNIIKSIESGANKFLVKPFDAKHLPDVIDELYINTQRRLSADSNIKPSLLFEGEEYVITAARSQILDLLLSSYEDSFYKNKQLQEIHSELEAFNGQLEQKIQERTKKLKLQETKYRTLAEHTPDLIARIDQDGNIVYINHAVEILFDISNEAVIGQSASLMEKKFTGCLCSLAIHEVFTTGKEVHEEYEVQLPNRKIWMDSIFVPEYDEAGNIEYVLKVSSDITMRKEAEGELLKLSQAVEQSPNSIIITDLNANIHYSNAAFTKMSGYTQAEVLGKNPRFLQSGKVPAATYTEMWEALINGKTWHGEFINRAKDGVEYIESIVASPIFSADGKISHYMMIKENITEKKRSEERINYLANFDMLTGLPNRAQMEEKVRFAINIAKRHESSFGMIFLDIDHFKDINDTLGHHVGDIVLIQIANRFQSVLRAEDAVSRFGGDEFIFLISGADQKRIMHVVKKLMDILAEPFKIEDNELMITVSMGIALYPIDGKDHEILSKNADAAMYRTKEEGRNGYRFFTHEMQSSSVRNLQLSNALHHALAKDQLYVVYQPQISLDDGRVLGAEALLRWTIPEVGSISPAEFIPLAEDAGLILPIGEWVLRSVVQQAKKWLEDGLPPMVFAVNVSAVQFRHPDLPTLVMQILDEAKLAPEYIELELTEAVAMRNPQKVCAIMEDLHGRGLRMAIDDFGTGYSSLSYLKKFKAYKLKIDQSFVQDINTDLDDRAIVKAIINLARSLGLKTIAEGVETVEQLDYLRQEGCDEVQGYYYSKPLLAADFEAFVRAH